MNNGETKKSKKILYALLDIGANFAIIFILVLVIQKWLIAPFDVSGSSMCDTLNIIDGECSQTFGEKIIINEALYLFNEPARGDIVVFKAPEENEEEKYFIKRVIGLPGEQIEIKDGEVYLTEAGSTEAIKLEEPYLNENNQGNTKTFFEDLRTFNVPEGKYFLLGDNRAVSTDSRSCFKSKVTIDCLDHQEDVYIDKKDIRGKAWVVWWPLSNMRHLGETSYPELVQANSESLAEK